MAHNQRVLRDDQWVRGYKPHGLDLAGIDQNTYVAINGDFGGTWLPLTPITIAGAGVVCAGPWTLSGQLNGTTGPITFNQATDDDYFQFSPTHFFRSQDPTQVLTEVYSEFPERAQVRLPLSDYAGIHIPAWHAQVGARFLTPLRVHNGSTLISVQLGFRVISPLDAPFGGVPNTPPRMRVIAVAADGTILPMRSAADSDTDDDGFTTFVKPPGPVTPWYQGATMYSMAYACVRNNAIDTGAYSYFVEIIDEICYAGSDDDEHLPLTASSPGIPEGLNYVSVIPICSNISLLNSRA